MCLIVLAKIESWFCRMVMSLLYFCVRLDIDVLIGGIVCWICCRSWWWPFVGFCIG